ncbi:MAG: hypothetical protein ABSA79_00540 [Candidatus Bathyarchaeia archaeon]|jgi:hypothetical protein
MPKMLKAFRFNPELYEKFKVLASESGYTVTGAFEKFMSNALEYGLAFPSATKVNEDAETEARVLLTLLKRNKYWVRMDEKKDVSVTGRLLQLLPNIKETNLRQDIEQTLKEKA